jgi:hypothetical protein
VLAGKFEIPEVQNAAIPLCKRRLDDTPPAVPTETVNYADTHTPSRSSVCRLVVNARMQKATTQQYMFHKDDLSRAFLKVCRKVSFGGRGRGRV